MIADLTVLVAGATGNQGGALTRRLLERGHRVRALTRSPASPGAAQLRALGVEIFEGHLEDTQALRAGMDGADAFFTITSFFEEGLEAEVRQGVCAANAARDAGIDHFVYSSVAQADTGTGVPHVETKRAVEEHLAGMDFPYSVVAPVWFMENVFAPWLPGLSEGRLAIAMDPDQTHQQVALADLAALTVVVLERREEFLGQRIDVASDRLTGAEAAEILARASGRPIVYDRVPIEDVLAGAPGVPGLDFGADLARMYEWFVEPGYQVDLAELRERFPEVRWHTFESWAWAQDWRVLDQEPAA